MNKMKNVHSQLWQQKHSLKKRSNLSEWGLSVFLKDASAGGFVLTGRLKDGLFAYNGSLVSFMTLRPMLTYKTFIYDINNKGLSIIDRVLAGIDTDDPEQAYAGMKN